VIEILKFYVSSVKSGKNSWTINFAHYSFNQAGDQASRRQRATKEATRQA
jgi:hypothetical protein